MFEWNVNESMNRLSKSNYRLMSITKVKMEELDRYEIDSEYIRHRKQEVWEEKQRMFPNDWVEEVEMLNLDHWKGNK